MPQEQQKKLKTFFDSAATVAAERRALQRAEKQAGIATEKAEAAEARRQASEDAELKAEQKALYKEFFKPALDALSTLRDSNGDHLFVPSVRQGIVYSPKHGRGVPATLIALNFTPGPQSLEIDLIQRERAYYRLSRSSGGAFTNVEGALKIMAERAVNWAPDQVGKVVRQQQRKAKAPAPKR